MAWTPRTKNSVLLSIAFHAVLALIGTLFIVTKDIEHDYIKVEWVKIPRTLRRVKSPEVKPVKPRIIPPRDLATHQVTPTPKPVDVKVAARRSFSLVENSVDLSIDAPEVIVGDVKTETRQAANPREVRLLGVPVMRLQGGRGRLQGVPMHRGQARLRDRRLPDVHRFMTTCWSTQ